MTIGQVTDVYTAILFDALPWWIAAPLLQIAILVFGMALDETYVNRATVMTGAIAVYAHTVIAGGAGLFVGLYLDIALIVGAYGVYAYVVDAYVGNWFRVLAFFVYSPVSVFLVILMAGPTVAGIEILFVPALLAAAVLNLQLMAYLQPTVPYYFGPVSPEEFEWAVAEVESSSTSGDADGDGDTPAVSSDDASGDDAPADPAASDDGGESFEEPDVSPDTPPETDYPGGEPATTGSRSTERGILPEFMRRL